ncbi:putative thymidine phosphorylase (plasmid) [Novosphingobium aromaticivorans DSM 12444]|uniref:Putative thymidine phosphorylase n=1 Tax=Novosphingobium aromaticivorans (strain ATCC 700278 / DSM 12444 / CCUG 56034 / CIP 105152 / NBRC 16084 / F199) TaxID=279238 RepID=A4XET0_NOVAD|nr:thymidine phosphorylase family protein [Novosphingobium aromaticivorans]ABP64441.1 putative thymidine phosphorylase [Novosphingobium aromaticivorans DSM 12444]SCY91109.1 thymidine phosphorylase [Novosphingobium aromaticivorans]
MALKIKRIAIDTHPENTAFLLRRRNGYSPEQFVALRKIEITGGDASILATLALIDDESLLEPHMIGLGEQAFRRLGLPEGAEVTFRQAPVPHSLEHVRRKIDGDELEETEIAEIIRDIAGYRYSPMEIGAFLVACAGFMSTHETLALTRAMAGVGRQMHWPSEIVVDKHCIGGIPGNRTSMIIVPIIAAHGLTMPKTSSRAITSPSGTADTMEVLASVDLPEDRLVSIVAKEHAVLAWGGRVNLSPADDVLITVERPLRIDTFDQMVASILSKKLAAGSTHLLIDIPVGPTAKVRTTREAIRLRKLFEYVGHRLGLVLDIVVTDGSQPVGRGVGPVLEARDVMAVLRNEDDAPRDLRERAVMLAGRVLEFDPALAGGKGYARAMELLGSGAALAAMERLIDAQGRCREVILPGSHVHDICAPAGGTVMSIDCHLIARIARLAGAPMDKGAGIDLLHKVGDRVRADEVLYRIHAHSPTGLEYARELAVASSGYVVG